MQSSIHTLSILNGKDKIVWEYPKRILPLCYCAILFVLLWHIATTFYGVQVR